ncbi:hypothetical protein SPSIL_050820 [Sporomusa silvacetica DSM 10669]|uniref:Class I SAM-dependent methyltransferase n=2 Tax=Sporomusa silvacetica TaxID=55504 RepID=A0ABZ3ITR6_9FIRM|nr:hypothetical protein SPSIL_36940 [Sporomusa silvacetica DSM 10669]
MSTEQDILREQCKMIFSEKEELMKVLAQYRTFVPPGHYYSPIPSKEDIQDYEQKAAILPETIAGVNLNEQGQIEIFNEFKKYYSDLPFSHERNGNLRYYYLNDFYSYGDAIALFCMLRHLKPKKIIEIGSGFSSAAMLDTNELFFDNRIDCTFIEPYPSRLQQLLKRTDNINLIQKRLQDVAIEEFSSLSRGDILFIDSTHVSKLNSDVNYLIFEIFPHLPSGVYIHFHDIFYPFEYPLSWLKEGRAWNEVYILRAFLQYNTAFIIKYFGHFMALFHRDKYSEFMPLCLNNPGGNIWIEKI